MLYRNVVIFCYALFGTQNVYEICSYICVCILNAAYLHILRSIEFYSCIKNQKIWFLATYRLVSIILQMLHDNGCMRSFKLTDSNK